jgi:hypothetical protein
MEKGEEDFIIKKIIEKLKTADSTMIITIYQYLNKREEDIKIGRYNLDRIDLNHDEYIQHVKEGLQEAVLYINKYQELTNKERNIYI